MLQSNKYVTCVLKKKSISTLLYQPKSKGIHTLQIVYIGI